MSGSSANALVNGVGREEVKVLAEEKEPASSRLAGAGTGEEEGSAGRCPRCWRKILCTATLRRESASWRWRGGRAERARAPAVQPGHQAAEGRARGGSMAKIALLYLPTAQTVSSRSPPLSLSNNLSPKSHHHAHSFTRKRKLLRLTRPTHNESGIFQCEHKRSGLPRRPLLERVCRLQGEEHAERGKVFLLGSW